MPLSGKLFIGGERVGTSRTFTVLNPTTGSTLSSEFAEAGPEHVAQACAAAEAAFNSYRSAPLNVRARFLEACAERIGTLGDELLERAGAESGLPRGRLEGERARTVNQLRLFAQLVRRGDWLGLRVDPAQPDRKPLARPDLRQRKVPLGPVVVFGASNFPLAFSAGGGDTASALAAGCPVIVKAHPAHPGASELVAGAICEAASALGIHPGVYGHLSGSGLELGAELVKHPLVQGVGFTGSRRGGQALMRLAQARPVPIPVYAEMSSINPVIILPAALRSRAASLASGFVASLTMGVGQFCTNPGLVLVIDLPEVDGFIAAASAALSSTPAATMLSKSIHTAFEHGVSRFCERPTVVQHGRGLSGSDGQGAGALFSVTGTEFLADTALAEEVFGPSSLIVRCRDEAELIRVLTELDGQLTVTLHLDPPDVPAAAALRPLLERKAGRILANGWPTGVEVAPAMVHGGPYPATSDGRSTSVGTLAIDRFLRPVCYQDLPAELLPPELRDGSDFASTTLVDGNYAP